MPQTLIKKFGINKRIFIVFTVAAALFFYFLFYTIFGSKGVLKYFSLNKELQRKESIQNNLYHKMENKQNLVNGMNSKSLDIDLLDEEARKNLGHADKNEIVIYEEEEK